MKLKIGIIGCGAIGTQIALACQNKLKEQIELSAICDQDPEKADGLKKKLNERLKILEIEALIKECDLVVEAASASVSGDLLEKCVKSSRDCMIMSVGGLIGRENTLAEAKGKNVKIYIPSGALSGVDGLKSASAGRIDSVTLTTRKPPKGLDGAPYIKSKNIDLSSIKKETVIFEGTAKEAIKGFPQNVNVSAVLSLAGLGSEKTKVRIITSPEYTKNVHEVEIKGESGTIFTRTENLPSSANPKTSALAIFSAIATLSGIADSVKIGT